MMLSDVCLSRPSRHVTLKEVVVDSSVATAERSPLPTTKPTFKQREQRKAITQSRSDAVTKRFADVAGDHAATWRVTRDVLHRGKQLYFKRSRSPGRFTHRGINASGSCSSERGNVLTVGTYCYVAVCRRGRLGGARRFGAHRGRRRAGHIVAAPAYSLFPAMTLVNSHTWKISLIVSVNRLTN